MATPGGFVPPRAFFLCLSGNDTGLVYFEEKESVSDLSQCYWWANMHLAIRV